MNHMLPVNFFGTFPVMFSPVGVAGDGKVRKSFQLQSCILAGETNL